MKASEYIHVNGLKLLKVKVKDLLIDPEYQRTLDESRAKKIGEGWRPDLGGIIVVSLRADGGLYTVDGQHRGHGLVLAGKGEMMIAVDVREGMTKAQEADLFTQLNRTRRPIKYSDGFRARLVAEEPIALEIKRIVEYCGLRLADHATRNGIAAVQSMETVHTRFEVLEPTLLTLKGWSKAKQHDPAAFDKRMIKYVGRFLYEFPIADTKVLTMKLVKFGRPEFVIGRVDKQSGYRDGSTPEANAVFVLLDIYNTNNRTKLTRDDRGKRRSQEELAA